MPWKRDRLYGVAVAQIVEPARTAPGAVPDRDGYGGCSATYDISVLPAAGGAARSLYGHPDAYASWLPANREWNGREWVPYEGRRYGCADPWPCPGHSDRPHRLYLAPTGEVWLKLDVGVYARLERLPTAEDMEAMGDMYVPPR